MNTNTSMIAKFQVTNVIKLEQPRWKSQELHMRPVSDKPYDTDGNSEDSSFARWTPAGELKMTITNPNLFDKFVIGDKYYLNFTKAE